MEMFAIVLLVALVVVFIKKEVIVSKYQGDKKLRAHFDNTGDEHARKLMRDAGYDV